MTDPVVDLTHSVLMQVGDFLRKLPADQLKDLAAGDARLAVVPKGARVSTSAATRTTATGTLSVSVTQFRDDLGKIDDRAAATRYIDDQKLTVAQLKQICAALDVPVSSKAKKADITRTIVELFVGARLDADAIMRHSTAPRG